MFRTRHVLAVISAICFGAAFCAPAAHAQTFSNAAAINMPTSTSNGVATLYPSSINVAGAPTSIGYVSVTLNGFSHTFVSDVIVLLVSPTGQKILLMSACNASADASNTTLTFIPDGTATLPSSNTNVVSGIYACSVYSVPSALPTPAPPGPYATSLAPLIGTNANGTWNLYAFDSFPSADNGSFAGGWSITFNQTPAFPVTTAFTYQGVLSASGTPINGDANVRFTLCNNATFPTSIAGIAPAITRSFTGITGGRITTTLNFGTVIDTSQALSLNIEVESPPGSGFVTLNPRQAITPTPQARVAQVATSTPWSGLTGQAAVTTGAIGAGWQMLFSNTANAAFRGGMRQADNGFFEVTNTANIASPNFARLASTGAWTAVSDARLKSDVTTAEGNLAAAMKLRPVSFRWKGSGAEDFGLIAQEVRGVLPKLVTGDESKDSLTLNYSQLSVVAIGAIQEQQAQRSADRAEIDRLAHENTDLKARLAAIEAALLKMNTNTTTSKIPTSKGDK
jgi:subtilisin-like proprotein convertase family protein